jgi:hypothetical protein
MYLAPSATFQLLYAYGGHVKAILASMAQRQLGLIRQMPCSSTA